jgi:hypothetical protein
MVIISNALMVSCSARTDSAATMNAVSVPLIHSASLSRFGEVA